MLFSGFNKDIFSEIYQTATSFNAKHQITGFLCFSHGYFFQYLEGSETEVRALFEMICQDKRHNHITQISDGYTNKRLFGDWNMNFLNLSTNKAYQDINKLFKTAKPLEWQTHDIKHIIGFMQQHHNTLPYNHSPICHHASTITLIKRHRYFLILQVVLIMLILLSFTTWLIPNPFFNP